MNAPDSIHELARIEEEIEYRLANVSHRISDLKHRSLPEEWQAGGDNTPLSEGADAAQAMEQRDSQNGQAARLIQLAAGLERALGRIQDGTYGTCEGCHRLIDPQRLHVLPEATLCLNCEEQQESSS